MIKLEFKRNQISEISKSLLSGITKNRNKKATILAFFGDLGAGKTAFTQELARHLGIKETIVSPTFVIMKIYKVGPKSKYFSHFKKLIHIDAYRVENAKELVAFGWEEIISDKENLVIVEWPEKVKSVIPKNAIKISLSHIDEETRGIKF